MENIIRRIPKGWIPSVDCGDGWKGIINELDEMLSFIDPNYEVNQVKEKYGTLRYYYQSKYSYVSTQGKIMNALVERAEQLSSVTCEDCGKARYGRVENIDDTVRLRQGAWWRTLCDTCATKHGYDLGVPEEDSFL